MKSELCQGCPRYKDGIFVPPQPGKKIVVVAEAPGKTEMERRVGPLVGKSGRLFTAACDAAGIDRKDIGITNAVLCGLPGNPTPGVEDISACRHNLEKFLDKCKPRIVVCLGKIAATALLGESKYTKIKTYRGSITTSPKRIVLGKRKVEAGKYKSGKKAGQPRYKYEVVEFESKKRDVLVTLHPAAVLRDGLISYPLLVADLMKAKRFPNLVEVGTRIETKLDSANKLESLLNRDKLVIDVETTRDDHRLTMIGISPGKDAAFVFKPTRQILGMLGKWLKDPDNTLVAHNVPFDSNVLAKACGVEVKAKWWDTMHAAQFESPHLRERTTSGGVAWNKYSALDQVASRMPYLRYTNWKEDFRSGGLDEWTYCGLDAATEFYLYEMFSKKFAKLGVKDRFENVLMKLLKILDKMEREGIEIDEEQLGRLRDRQEHLIKAYEKRWNKLTNGVNWKSSKAKMKYFYDDLGLKVMYTGRPKRRTLDREALQKLYALYPDCEELNVLVKLMHLKSVFKYLDLKIENGKFHPVFNMSGTRTGRFSSNIQQIPRPGEKCVLDIEGCSCTRMRSIYIGDNDEGIIAADYSQIEARITALLAGEKELVKAFERSDFDYHQNTADLVGVSRFLGKKLNHASNYMMGAKKFAAEVGISVELAEKYLRKLHKSRPGLVRWWKKVENEVYENGYVVNPFGRRWYAVPKWNGNEFLFKTPEAVAFLPQSTALDVIIGAMVRAHDAGLKLRLQIHDELVCSWECEDDPEVLKECMEYEVEELGGWKCPVDIGMGRTWEEAKK